MLKKVTITNYLGESMEYLIEGVQPDNESGLLITSIDGLGPAKANINMTDLVATDGQLFNSARLSSRNIVIKALFTNATSIEESRYLSYRYFPIKSKIKFEIETDNRTATTEGYVESNEPDIFSEESGCQISIICGSAYFEGDDLDFIIDSAGSDVVNYGDVDTGVTISFTPFGGDIYSEISIVKNSAKGSQSMAIDPARFDGIVPNSSPTNDSLEKLVFNTNGEGDNDYLCKIPQGGRPATTAGTASNYAVTMCQNILHVIDFNPPAGAAPSQEDVSGEWKRHMGLDIFHGRYVMYGIDDPGLDFTPVTDVTTQAEKDCLLQNGIATFNGKIHLISRLFKETYYTEGFYGLAHKVWDPEKSTWRYINDKLVVMFHDLSIINHTGFRVNGLVVYDQHLHLFCTDQYEDWYGSTIRRYIRLCHYVWNETTNDWDILLDEDVRINGTETESTSGIPVWVFRAIHGTSPDKAFMASIDGEKIHFFYELYNYEGNYEQSDHHHITWDSINGFQYSFEPPSDYYNNTNYIHGIDDAVIAPIDGTIHILGGYRSNTSAPLKWHYAYDSSNGTWESLNNLSHGYSNRRISSGVSASYNQIFLIGNGDYTETYTGIANNTRIERNDTLEICTEKGKKSITLYRGNKKYNVLKSMKKGSEWISVNMGRNYFVASGYVSLGGELSTVVRIRAKFQGV